MKASKIATLISVIALVSLVINHVVIAAFVADAGLSDHVLFFVKLDHLAVDFGYLLIPLLWFATFVAVSIGLIIRRSLDRSKSVPIFEDIKASRKPFVIASQVSTVALMAWLVFSKSLMAQDATAPVPEDVLFFIRLGHFFADYGYVLIPLLWFAIFAGVSIGLTIRSWFFPPKPLPTQEDWPVEP